MKVESKIWLKRRLMVIVYLLSSQYLTIHEKFLKTWLLVLISVSDRGIITVDINPPPIVTN